MKEDSMEERDREKERVRERAKNNLKISACTAHHRVWYKQENYITYFRIITHPAPKTTHLDNWTKWIYCALRDRNVILVFIQYNVAFIQ